MVNEFYLDFAKIKIINSLMIVEVNEGIHLSTNHHEELEEIAQLQFENNPFIYITNRVHSYSVDPAIYKLTSQISNLKGFAVVTKTILAKKNAELEKLFLNKPFEIFSEIDEAISWAKSVIDNKFINGKNN